MSGANIVGDTGGKGIHGQDSNPAPPSDQDSALPGHEPTGITHI